jgi:hypothetical protein
LFSQYLDSIHLELRDGSVHCDDQLSFLRFLALSGCCVLTRYLSISAIASILLFLALDFIISRYYIVGSNLNLEYRVKHDVFHHSLRPKFSGTAHWGAYHYKIRSNSLGFVDESPRDVAKISARSRIVLMGDSFTEGQGIPWGQTFAGIMANDLARGNPPIEVLNAALSGYSPSIYFIKSKWLLEQGYKFDHVIVMIDISDILNETWFTIRDGVVYHTADGAAPVKQKPADLRQMTVRNFQLSRTMYQLLRGVSEGAGGRSARIASELEEVAALCLSSWTYDSANPRTQIAYWSEREGRSFDPIEKCPKQLSPLDRDSAPPQHIEAAVQKAVHWMNELHALLDKSGIKLSVGVYPWPAQLHYDSVASRQVEIWQSWCKNRCSHFINLFPDFFEQKNLLGPQWYRELFLPGDVHWNARGHRVVANGIRAALATP